jgi:hypothetical protein
MIRVRTLRCRPLDNAGQHLDRRHGVRNDSLIVVVRRIMLKDGYPGPQVPTFSMSVGKVPTDTLPVLFSQAHIKIQCDEPGSWGRG